MPETERKDGDHPTGVVEAGWIHLADDPTTPNDHTAEKHRADEQDVSPVNEEAHTEFVHWQMVELAGEGQAYLIGERIDDGAWDV